MREREEGESGVERREREGGKGTIEMKESKGLTHTYYHCVAYESIEKLPVYVWPPKMHAPHQRKSEALSFHASEKEQGRARSTFG